MRYKIYEITNLSNDERYISATNTTKDFNRFRLTSRDMNLRLLKSPTRREVLSVVDDVTSAIDELKRLDDLYRNDPKVFVFRIDKRKTFIDCNGNKIKAYSDDPRCALGELKHFLCGFVTVRDADGNCRSVSRDSDEYASGDLAGVNRGRVVVKDSFGNFSCVSVRDDRYLSGELIHVSKGTLVVKDSRGNRFVTRLDDPRYVSGELVASNRGKSFVHYNPDTKTRRRLDDKYVTIYPKFKHSIKSYRGVVTVKEFCEHGDVVLSQDSFDVHYRMNEGRFICERCREEMASTLPNDEEVRALREEYVLLLRDEGSNRLLSESFVRTYRPDIARAVSCYTTMTDARWSEKTYAFRHGMKSRPKCKCDGCDEDVTFADPAKHYNSYCDVHKFTYKTSTAEKEVYDHIVKHYSGKVKRADRHLGKEMDVYLPQLNLGIEYNGTYHHSSLFKTKEYHYDKWKMCHDAGIDLFTIWDSDWMKNEKLIKLLLLKQMGMSDRMIEGKDCEIVELTQNDCDKFLDENHVNGRCDGDVRLGLMHEGELVLLTLMDKDEGSLSFTLRRVCEISGATVKEGVKLLVKNFIELYEPDKLVAYADLNLNECKTYEGLGFTEKGHSGFNQRFVYDSNGKEKAFKGFETWDVGNIRYEYERSN